MKAPCTATHLYLLWILRSRQCKHKSTQIAWYLADFHLQWHHNLHLIEAVHQPSLMQCGSLLLWRSLCSLHLKDILSHPLAWRSVGHHLSKMPLAVLLLLCWSPPSERPCCLLPADLPTVVASGWRNTTWNILTSHPPLSTKGNRSLSHDIPLTSQRYLCTKCRAVWYAEKDKEDQQSSQCNHRSTELLSGIQPP